MKLFLNLHRKTEPIWICLVSEMVKSLQAEAWPGSFIKCGKYWSSLPDLWIFLMSEKHSLSENIVHKPTNILILLIIKFDSGIIHINPMHTTCVMHACNAIDRYQIVRLGLPHITSKLQFDTFASFIQENNLKQCSWTAEQTARVSSQTTCLDIYLIYFRLSLIKRAEKWLWNGLKVSNR